jgi:cytochrome oxidase Cu insertion factor (SCO1/SenC/PrrC family)/cytochrome c2
MLSIPQGVPAAEKGGSIWGADYFPEVQLITHEGKKVRFFTDVIKDRVVAINFIYTNCPDACGLETARLREVQKILEDRVGRDVFLYSITIDPERDTRKVLKQYADKFQAGPGWLFLTGKKEDITLLRKKFGLYDEEGREEKLTEHDLSLIIGNQSTGQWMKVSPYENPYVLAEQLGSWLHNWKMPPKYKRDYAEAPALRSLSKGEELFRTRCAACHTIGAEAVAEAGTRPLGPDLLSVTKKRDRAWLTRWLTEPDKMLAEKDPLAMAQLAEYNNLAMPNLGLSDLDIQNLLAYIEEESRRLEHHRGEHHHQ